jgi:phage terminase small subunit
MPKINEIAKNSPAKTKDKPMSIMQLAFCHEMVIDPNQTQAAIRAGYSARSARQKASKLMTKDNIREKIMEIRTANWDKSIMTRSEGLSILSKQARADLTQIIDEDGNLDMAALRKMGPGVKEFSQETIYRGEDTIITRKIKVHDPRGAIMELAKQMGWAPEVDPDDPDGGNIFINIQNNFNQK